MAGFDITGSYLSSLVEESADAQGNLYCISFVGGSKSAINSLSANNSKALSIRTKSFNWKMPEQEPYEIKFLTIKINRPKAKVKIDRSFDFTVRVDANYELYKVLLKQEKLTFSPGEHWATNDICKAEEDGKLFSVTVNVTKGTINSSKIEEGCLCKLDGCYITSIVPLAFKQGSSDPLEVKVNCKYLYLNDAFYNKDTSSSSKYIGKE